MNFSQNPLPDAAIVSSILGGNTQAFAGVVKNTEKLVMHIVQKMISNPDDQKDLVQEIYLKAYQNLPSFQFRSRLSTWIGNIAYNTTVNYLQKKKIPLIGLDETRETKYAVTAHAEQEMIRTETVAVLRAAIDQLPPLYKTLITLYHLEGLPNKEIADITGLPEGTIKSYLSRARKILKDSIYPYFQNARV